MFPHSTSADGFFKTCSYDCTSSGTLAVLDCVDVLSGAPFSVPITVGKREVEARQTSSYCCNPDVELAVVQCTDILSGSILSAPITLFPGLTDDIGDAITGAEADIGDAITASSA